MHTACDGLTDEGAKAVGWNSAASQALRFQVLSDELLEDIVPHGKSLLDVGCGDGALLRWGSEDWLQDFGEFGTYVGIDTNEASLEMARGFHADRAFIEHDICSDAVLANFDIVVCSGAFNLKGHEEHLFTALENMWRHTQVALAFNCLSTFADPWLKGRIYRCPFKTAEWVAEHLSPDLRLICDYKPNDFTIIVRR